jgi:hypothetical protein
VARTARDTDRACLARAPLLHSARPPGDCRLFQIRGIDADVMGLNLRAASTIPGAPGRPGQTLTVLWAQIEAHGAGRDTEGDYVDLLLRHNQLLRLYFRDPFSRDRFAAALGGWMVAGVARASR